VRHHNSVFHDLLKRVPWDKFERLTKEHGADRPVYVAVTAAKVNDITAAQTMPEINGDRAVAPIPGTRSRRRSQTSDRPQSDDAAM